MRTEEQPLVSVLLPVYNAQSTIIESLNSIVNQTYQNMEIIVINDGSNDNSESLISSLSDKRISFYSNDCNRGIVYTLNRGLQLAHGKYIARMDADDISLPTRIEEEVRVMEEQPEIVVCGCDVEVFSDSKRKLPKSIVVLADSDGLKSSLAMFPCFAHPTVMIRKSILDEYKISYDSGYLHAEDYKMWVDLASCGEFHIIPKKLLRYRISDTQITQRTNIQQIETTKRIRLLYIHRFVGEGIAERMKKEGVSLSLLKTVKKKTFNKYLLQVLYSSFPKYNGEVVSYYFASLDCFRLGWMTFLLFMKRLLLGSNPFL